MKSTRYFVKYHENTDRVKEPMDSYRICKEDVHPRKLYPYYCAVLIEQGYTETDFITEWDAHAAIVKEANAAPTWREGNLILDHKRSIVNAIKYPVLHKMAEEMFNSIRSTPTAKEAQHR